MDTNTNTESAAADTGDVTALLDWDAPTLPRHRRTRRWYVTGLLLMIAAVVYGVIIGAWTMVVLAVLIGVMYYLVRGAEPPLKHMSLTTHGVFFDGAFTRWEDCTGFWIVQNKTYTKLYIGRRNRRQGDIAIMVEGVEPTDVRWTLAKFLSEQTDRGESVLDIIVRVCKL
jgi:hypothetical protein